MKRWLALALLTLAASLASGVVMIDPYRFAAAPPSFSGEVYYVDPSASTSTEDGTTANPYKSLMAALSGKCNKTFTQPIQIRCRTSSSTADTTRATTEGLTVMVTSSTNYLQIIAETGHRAGTSWDSTKYNLSVPFASGAGAGVALKITHSYVRVDGLQISVSSQAGQDATCEIVYTSEDSGKFTTCTYSNLLIKGTNDSGAGGYTRGISVIYGVNMYNCIIYNLGSAVGSSAVKNHGSSNFYSCTFIGNSSAIITFDHSNDGSGNGTAILKNCYAGRASYHDYDATSPATMTMTTCASSDTTATGTSPQVSKAVNTTQFTNVTAGSENWSIPGTSALKATGTDTSGDSFPFNFTTDITGSTRSGTWDIGAAKF